MEVPRVSQDPELCESTSYGRVSDWRRPSRRPKQMAAVLVLQPKKGQTRIQGCIINPVIVSESVQYGALTEGEGCLRDKDVPGYVHAMTGSPALPRH